MNNTGQPQLDDLLPSLGNLSVQPDSENTHEEGNETQGCKTCGCNSPDHQQGPDIFEGTHNGQQSTPISDSADTGILKIGVAVAQQAQATTTFTPFRHLPAETRIKIWKLSLPDPRSLTPHPHYVSEETHGQSALSALFDACFESKEIINKIYPLCFGDQLLGNAIRFSPDRDTIVFPSTSSFSPYSPTLPHQTKINVLINSFRITRLPHNERFLPAPL